MRCLIATLSLYVNYGGILQCWALQNIVEGMGHDVSVLRLPSHRITIKKVISNLYKRLLSVTRRNGSFYPIKLTEFLQYNFAFIKTRRFIRKSIHYTPKIYGLDNIKDINDLHYDAYIVGSDQVWRSLYTGAYLDIFFLTFTETGSHKIAYAASFGLDYPEYSTDEISKYGNYYSLFDAVSVREASGIKLIEKYGWKSTQSCSHVLDPTMLLDSDFYIQKLCLNKKQSSPYLFVYLLSKNSILSTINQVSNELNLSVIESKLIDDSWSSIFKIRMSPPEWLESIYNSQFVITDSFHGCVFSIIFRKNFIVFCNKVRGNERIQSLLNMFNLSSRLVVSNDDFINRKTELMKPINYFEVYQILDKRREESLVFLRNALKL